MRQDGLAINIVPNSYWRLLSTALFYPVKLSRLAAYLISRFNFRRSDLQLQKSDLRGNNLKLVRKKRRFFDLVVPPPHGISANSFSEILAFRKKVWIKIFERNGFDVIDVIDGPISSGYGIGFYRVKKVLEALGVTTEYIYVLKKR